MPRVFYKSHYFTNHGHVLNHLEYLEEQGALFTGTKEIGLGEAQAQASEFMQARKWWFVFSLTREDQQRLQIDRSYFQQLVETQKAIWAKAYNIPIERLHVYASFHDTAHHPHIHVVLHGETRLDGYILRKRGQKLGDAFKNCRETVKGTIANEIFREDTLHLKVEKSSERKELNEQLERLMLQIGRSSHPVHPKLQDGMLRLADALMDLPGKHQYGYLPPELKTAVDELLEQAIELDPQLEQVYQIFRDTQKKLIEYLYVDNADTLAQKMAEWEKEFYHPPKGKDTRRHNLIIQSADSLLRFLAEKYGVTACVGESEAELENLSREELRSEAELLSAGSELYKKEDTLGKGSVPLTSEPCDADPQAAAQTANLVGGELYKKETGEEAAASPEAAPRLTAEQEKALEEIEGAAVRTIEKELSGRFWGDLAAEMRALQANENLKKGGWENQRDSVKEALLSAEALLEEKIPELEEAVLATSEIRQCTPEEALESMELLHYRVLQYTRHVSDDNYISLKSMQAEKDTNRYFQMFSSAVRREIVAALDQNPELQVIATDIQSQAPTISEDGKEVPVSYKTLPSALQNKVNKLIESCWRSPEIQEAAQILYNKFSKDEDQKKFFEYLLQGGRNASIAQRAAVKALLSFSLYEPELSAAPEAPASDQVPTAPEAPADDQVPVAPEAAVGDETAATQQKEKEQEKLKEAIRDVRYKIEKDLLHNPQLQHFLGDRLLRISAMANPETGVQSYQKMSTDQQNAVNTCLRELLELPQFKLIANKVFSSFCTVEDIIAQPTALHQLIVDYAAAATKEHPVDLLLKKKRAAGYKLLCTWDKLLCDTLNAAKNAPDHPDHEEVKALIQKLFDKARTPREKAEYVPPDYYRQLSPPEQEQLAVWLQSVYDKSYPLKRAIQERSLLDRCADPAAWFKKHLEESTEFQNLAVQHLKERFLNPDKQLTPKFELSDYHAKSQAAAMRGLLHLIGLTMRDDANRNQAQSRQSAKQKSKLKTKKIHRESIKERGQKRDALEP